MIRESSVYMESIPIASAHLQTDGVVRCTDGRLGTWRSRACSGTRTGKGISQRLGKGDRVWQRHGLRYCASDGRCGRSGRRLQSCRGHLYCKSAPRGDKAQGARHCWRHRAHQQENGHRAKRPHLYDRGHARLLPIIPIRRGASSTRLAVRICCCTSTATTCKRYLFDLLDELGYRGWVGCEYRPRNGTWAGLSWAAKYGINNSRPAASY